MDELMLLSGIDLPFPEAQLVVHQPRIKEIGLIGENEFFYGIRFLNFSKDILVEQDKSGLQDKSDFEILMTMMNNKDPQTQKMRNNAIMVLTLLFPEYSFKITSAAIILTKRNGEEQKTAINVTNYQQFKDILVKAFSLDGKGTDKKAYNPEKGRAEKIAEKLMDARKKRAKRKGISENISILTRYASILSVGLPMDLNSIMNLTIYQLYDEFQRYTAKVNYDTYFDLKLAGAEKLEEVDNWMDDLHS